MYLSWTILFSITLCAVVSGKECVTYNFEENFDTMFPNNVVCGIFPANWIWNFYNNTSIEPPHEYSTRFIRPTPLHSCSSTGPIMISSGTLEVNAYVDSDVTGHLTILLLDYNNDINDLGRLQANLDDIEGWQTFNVEVEATEQMYVSIVFNRVAAEHSKVLIDSFRFIPQDIIDPDYYDSCRIYSSPEETTTDSTTKDSSTSDITTTEYTTSESTTDSTTSDTTTTEYTTSESTTDSTTSDKTTTEYTTSESTTDSTTSDTTTTEYTTSESTTDSTTSDTTTTEYTTSESTTDSTTSDTTTTEYTTSESTTDSTTSDTTSTEYTTSESTTDSTTSDTTSTEYTTSESTTDSTTSDTTSTEYTTSESTTDSTTSDTTTTEYATSESTTDSTTSDTTTTEYATSESTTDSTTSDTTTTEYTTSESTSDSTTSDTTTTEYTDTDNTTEMTEVTPVDNKECVTYNFEENFDIMFPNYVVCEIFPANWIWDFYNYTSIEPPHEYSTRFIKPTRLHSCSSSGPIMMSSGTLEVNAYVDSDVTGNLTILLLDYNNHTNDLGRLQANLDDIEGWQIFYIEVEATEDIYVSIVFNRAASEHSEILIDAFRFIAENITDPDYYDSCRIYSSPEVTTTDSTTTATEETPGDDDAFWNPISITSVVVLCSLVITLGAIYSFTIFGKSIFMTTPNNLIQNDIKSSNPYSLPRVDRIL